MKDIHYDKICTQLDIDYHLLAQVKDKILDNITLDDVEINVVAAYINKCTMKELLELNEIANVLDDWQLVGRIIGNSVLNNIIED